MGKRLIVITGPTGAGKTDLSIGLAQRLGTEILSADSRQIYRGMEIGTAAPTAAQLSAVRHHFIGIKEPGEYYSAAQFESDAIALLGRLFAVHDTVVAVGGSMMYVDALCNGIDDIPTVDAETRAFVLEKYNAEGLGRLAAELKLLDPDYYATADIRNPKRVMHALEICYMTGRTYSSFRVGASKPRDFDIVKICLSLDREVLYDRINRRVDRMVADGLADEAGRLLPMRHTNSLNTVGYKEMFRYLDGEWTLDFAIDKIKQNTRIYSRKQMTWFRRDTAIHWFDAGDGDGVASFVSSLE